MTDRRLIGIVPWPLFDIGYLLTSLWCRKQFELELDDASLVRADAEMASPLANSVQIHATSGDDVAVHIGDYNRLFLALLIRALRAQCVGLRVRNVGKNRWSVEPRARG